MSHFSVCVIVPDDGVVNNIHANNLEDHLIPVLAPFDEQTEEETQDQLPAQEAQDGPEPRLEEQPADLEDTDSVADDQADSSENDQTEETWEEETQEDEEGFADGEEVEDTNTVEDNELGDDQEDEESWDGETSNEESQDEEEEQAYQPSMAW